MQNKKKERCSLELMNLKHIDSNCEDDIINILTEFPDLYSLISVPMTPRLNEFVIQSNPRYVLEIKNPPAGLFYEALKRDPTIIRYIKNPTKKQCIAAVSANWISIRFISEKYITLQLRKNAYDQSGYALNILLHLAKFPEILYVAKNYGYAFTQISEARLFQRIKDIIVKKTDETNQQFLIEFIHARMRTIYEKAALSPNGNYIEIRNIPREYVSDELIKNILINRPSAIYSLPEDLVTMDYIRLATPKISDAFKVLPNDKILIDLFYELYDLNPNIASYLRFTYCNIKSDEAFDFLDKKACKYDSVYKTDFWFCSSVGYNGLKITRSMLIRFGIYDFECNAAIINHITLRSNNLINDMTDHDFYLSLIRVNRDLADRLYSYNGNLLSIPIKLFIHKQYIITYGLTQQPSYEYQRLSCKDIIFGIKVGTRLINDKRCYKTVFHYYIMKLFSLKQRRSSTIPYKVGH